MVGLERDGITDPDTVVHHFHIEATWDLVNLDPHLFGRGQAAVTNAVRNEFGQEQHDAVVHTHGKSRPR